MEQSTEEKARAMGLRFKQELKRRSISPEQAAGELGVSRSTVYNWFETAQFNGVQLSTLSDYGINVDFVLYGEEAWQWRPQPAPDTLSSEDIAYQLAPGGTRITARSDGVVRFTYDGKHIEIDASDYEFVPVFNVEFGAGPGRFVNFDEPPMAWDAYRKTWLRSAGLLGTQLFKGCVRGDSMYPLLTDKSWELFNASDKTIRSGGIYGIRIGEENIVKYLRTLPGGLIEVSSHNQDPKHAPFTIRADDLGNGVEIVGALVR